jgi:protein gp37
MGETDIEWATHTINWQAGCTKVSPACKNCYAMLMSRRQEHMARARGDRDSRYIGVTDERGEWTGVVNAETQVLGAAFDELRRSRKPRRVFVGSMTDIFHENVDMGGMAPLWRLAFEVNKVEHDRANGSLVWTHVLMLLTKRPERLREWQERYFPGGLPPWLWAGTTAENQEWADKRVPELLRVKVQPGGVRFLSLEPMLGRVDLDPMWCDHCDTGEHVRDEPGTQPWCIECDSEAGHDAWLDGCAQENGRGIGWVIVGGESGPGARPMHPQWARDVRDQCAEAGVPFFFKQWGEWSLGPKVVSASFPSARLRWASADGVIANRSAGGTKGGDGHWLLRVGKTAAGRLLDGRAHDAFPVARVHAEGGDA